MSHAYEEETYAKTTLGFWVYLLTDVIMFAALFAVYLVSKDQSHLGPPLKGIVHLPAVHIRTLILLSASFTAGLGAMYAHRQEKKKVWISFILTFCLGLIFTFMQMQEFSSMLAKSASWRESAALSGFFTLVGTHLIHVLFGLLFIILFLIGVVMRGLDATSVRRLSCLKMFWQFVNVVWIFIFTVVYLMGVGP